MASFRLIHPHGIGASEIDAIDASCGGKPRNVLRERTPLHAFLQVCGDPVRYQFERQFASFVLAIKRMMWKPYRVAIGSGLIEPGSSAN